MKKYLIFLKTHFYDSAASYQKSKEIMEWKALKASKASFMTLDTIWARESSQALYRPQIWKTTNTMDFPDSPIALNKSTEIALKHDSISDYCAHFQGPSDNSFPDLYLTRESLAAPL